MGGGCVGDYSIRDNLSAMTAGTGLRPDPAAFFYKTIKEEALIPRRAPSMAHGGLFMGQKIFENYCIIMV
jgi:hypothetical protein